MTATNERLDEVRAATERVRTLGGDVEGEAGELLRQALKELHLVLEDLTERVDALEAAEDDMGTVVSPGH